MRWSRKTEEQDTRDRWEQTHLHGIDKAHPTPAERPMGRVVQDPKWRISEPSRATFEAALFLLCWYYSYPASRHWVIHIFQRERSSSGDREEGLPAALLRALAQAKAPERNSVARGMFGLSSRFLL